MKVSLQFKLLLIMVLLSIFSIVLTSTLIRIRIQDHFQLYSRRIEQSLTEDSPRALLNLRGLRLGWTRNQQFFLNEVTRSLYLSGLFTILLAFIFSYLAVKWMIQPMKRMVLATKRLGEGHLSFRIKESSHDEWSILADSFNHMAERLEKTEELRKELISNLSHELSTPLTNIIGYLEAWSDKLILDQDQKEDVIQLLVKESTRLKKMVDDLRELSLVEADNFYLNKKPIQIQEFVQTLISSIKISLEKKHIKLKHHIDPDLEVIICDPVRLHQVLLNILQNAIQFSDSDTTITMDFQKKANDHLEIKITDQGIGISEHDLPHIFERFYRAEPSRSRFTGGTGIGLAISKQLILAHKGSIHAISKPGKGSSMVISLPLQ